MKRKKVYSSVLSLFAALVVGVSGILPTSTALNTFADDTDEESMMEYDVKEGECGDKARYYLDARGQLYIDGEGEINQTAEFYEIADECKSVRIEYGITSIGEQMFLGAKNMESVFIPSSVTKINDTAFYGTAIKEVTIPESVESVGAMAFGCCPDLERIVIFNPNCEIHDEESTISGYYDDKTGSYRFNGSIKGYPGSTAEKYAQKFNKTFVGFDSTAPEIVESGSIGTNVSYSLDSEGLLTVTCNGESDDIFDLLDVFEKKVERAVIGDGITECSFQGCTSLESVQLPDSLTAITYDAFAGCTSLKEISIPASVSIIKNNAFRNCTSLTSIVIPDSVKEIGGDAFNGCKNLSSIIIPDGLDEIGALAFYDTAWIKNRQNEDPFVVINGVLVDGRAVTDNNAVIPDTVKSIGKDAFSSSDIAAVTIPDSVVKIDDYAFNSCNILESINIPDSVSYIGYGAFSECKSLSSVVIPESLTNFGGNVFEDTPFLTNKLKESPFVIINDALIDGSALSGDVTVPSGVRIISSFAVNSNDDLTSVTLPDTVTSIEEYAFAWCENLKTADIGSSVCKIGDSSFYDCKSLEVINIPETVEVIDQDAFHWCTSLKSIVLPSRIKEIKTGTFANCEKLESLTILNPECVIADDDYTLYSSYDETSSTPIFIGTLNGYKGSTAEEYAKKNDYSFVAIDGGSSLNKFGDPNSDGKVDANDASFILVEYSKLSTGGGSAMKTEQKEAADVNKDTKVDSKDASLILAYYSYLSTGGDSDIEGFIARNGRV